MVKAPGNVWKNILRYQEIIDDFDGFVDALMRPLPRTFWLHPGSPSLSHLSKREGWDIDAFIPLKWRDSAFRDHSRSDLGRSIPYLLGDIHIQEEVSMIPVYILNPQPGDKILDLCAAPGNKTVQIALKMANRGTVIANDRDPKRLSGVRSLLSRLMITNVSTVVQDGLRFSCESNFFDGVLADVPCSCEGTARKSPKVFNHSLADLVPLGAGLQIGLLRKAIDLCRPGGSIIYSTCTFRPEENEMVVDHVLRNTPTRLIDIKLEGFDFSPGLTSWLGKEFRSELHKSARIWPHLNDTGGFFIAHLRKESV